MIKKKFLPHEEILPLIVPDTENVEQALHVLNEQGLQILLVIDSDKKLVGIVTDSDLRRAVLQGVQLSDRVDKLMQKKYKSVGYNDWLSNPRIGDPSGYNHIPVLSDGSQIAGLLIATSLLDEQHKEVPIIDTPVVIMAGGMGSRLAPFTNILPKPMLPVGDSTVLEKILESFYKQGFREFYVIVNHKKELIKAYFRDTALPFNLTFVEETQPLGTAGGLSLLAGKLLETFILSNADIISDVNFLKAIEWHVGNNAFATIISVEKLTSIPYGTVKSAKNGKVLSISEKPEIKHQIISGLYIFDKQILDHIPSNKPIDMDHLLRNLMGKRQSVMTYNVASNWLDMGEFSEYREFLKFFGAQN